MIVKDFKTRQKKKMKFTGRMIRLTVTLALVIAAALGLLFLIFRRESAGLVLMWIPPFAVIILAPWLTWLAAYSRWRRPSTATSFAWRRKSSRRGRT